MTAQPQPGTGTELGIVRHVRAEHPQRLAHAVIEQAGLRTLCTNLDAIQRGAGAAKRKQPQCFFRVIAQHGRAHGGDAHFGFGHFVRQVIPDGIGVHDGAVQLPNDGHRGGRAMQAVDVRVAPGVLPFQVTRQFADGGAGIAHFLRHTEFARPGVIQIFALPQESAVRFELLVLRQGKSHGARKAAVCCGRLGGRRKAVADRSHDVLVGCLGACRGCTAGACRSLARQRKGHRSQRRSLEP